MLGWIKNAIRLECRAGLKIVDTIDGGPPMQIHYQVPMPTIGTNEFKNTRVVVHATKNILEEKPFEWVVAGFAHELSHVVLSSIKHSLEKEEKAVDLTAMILGFEDFVAESHYAKSNEYAKSSEFASLGYLSIPEMKFALGSDHGLIAAEFSAHRRRRAAQ